MWYLIKVPQKSVFKDRATINMIGSDNGLTPNRGLYLNQSLQWRHNHQPHHCLLNRLFRRRSKKTSNLRVTGICAGNSPGTGEFPAKKASNAENVSIWWRHHGHRTGDFIFIKSRVALNTLKECQIPCQLAKMFSNMASYWLLTMLSVN